MLASLCIATTVTVVAVIAVTGATASAVICLILLLPPLFLLTSDCDPWLALALALDTAGWYRGRLRGRVVWLTGASSGIGAALALELARRGCRLALSSRRRPLLEEIRDRCVKETVVRASDILVLPLDVSVADEHQAALDKLLAFFGGRLDVLVHCAGRSQRARWLHTEVAVDRQLYELNTLAAVQLTRLALPVMLRSQLLSAKCQPETTVCSSNEERSGGSLVSCDGSDGGITTAAHIVVVSSTAGTIPAPFSCAYTAAKHALHRYFDSLRLEMPAEKLDVTLLCPGPTFSQLLEVAATETAARCYGGQMTRQDRRMSVERCALLCAVAISARLDEAWMAVCPVLLVQYAVRFCPQLARFFMRRIGATRLMRLRDSSGVQIADGGH